MQKLIDLLATLDENSTLYTAVLNVATDPNIQISCKDEEIMALAATVDLPGWLNDDGSSSNALEMYLDGLAAYGEMLGALASQLDFEGKITFAKILTNGIRFDNLISLDDLDAIIHDEIDRFYAGLVEKN